MEAHREAHEEAQNVQKFQGGGGWVTKAAVIGVIGLLIGLVGIFIDRKAGLYAYLTAFTYWAGIAFTSLVLLMIFHAFRAKWPTVLRRPLEAMATSVGLFLPLALPLLIFTGDIYSWVHPSHDLPHHALELIEHKKPYLNVPFFIARTVIYFVIAIVIANRLFNLSVRSDLSGDPQLLQRQRNLGTGGLPLMAMVLSFAAFDWLMSLDPLWFSTIFGVYYFSGSILCTIAILILVLNKTRLSKDNVGFFVSVEHLHNLGKLLFAFICFWGYIAVSQFLLIWIADLPEETPFYIVRMHGYWKAVSIVLIVGHFVVPFFLLLSRDLKRRPARLSILAVWALIIHFVDIYWLVIPSLTEQKGPVFPIFLPFIWIGIGGLAAAFTIRKFRGHYPVPVKDPFLPASLHYRQPV